MKRSKLILAALATLVCLNVLFAGNPKRNYSDNMTDNLLNMINADVNLTDSQKIAIKSIAGKFVNKLKNSNEQVDSVFIKTVYKPASVEYQTALDNILTPEQKDTLLIKRIERSQLSIKNNKNK